MPFNKDGKRTNSPMKYGRVKKPNAHHPMSFNAKRVEAVKAGKDSFEVGGKSFPVTSKAMMYKPQINKGPYMMKPGRESATRNTPGPFRAEVPYMYNTPNAIKPMYTGKKSNIDPDLVTEAVRDFKVRKPKTQGDSISLTHTMRKVGSSPQSETDSRFRFYEKAGPKGGLKSMKEKIAEAKAKRKGK